MIQKDKDEFTTIVVDALNTVMVPALDNMATALKEELASKEELKEVKMGIDSLDRKFDAQQERQDRHNKRIESLEKLHPSGKHSVVAA